MRYDLTTALVVVDVQNDFADLAGSLSVRGGEAVVVAPNAGIAGSWGPALHPALDVGGPVVRKGTNGEDGYSGFTMRDPVTGATVPTELDALLRERGIRRVGAVGPAADSGVKATRPDAAALGVDTPPL